MESAAVAVVPPVVVGTSPVAVVISVTEMTIEGLANSLTEMSVEQWVPGLQRS